MNAPSKTEELQPDQAQEQAKPADAEAAPPEVPAEPIRPIKKVTIEEGHGGAHGGAWKIALADMMTAMMAFFLLMWLLGATQEEKRKSVAEYLKPTSQSVVTMGKLAGSNGLLGGSSIIDVDGFKFRQTQTGLLSLVVPRSEAGPDVKDGSSDAARNREGTGDHARAVDERQEQTQQNFEKLQQEIKAALKSSTETKGVADTNVNIVMDADGLKIDLMDGDKMSMFKLGTSQPNDKAIALISKISKILAPTSSRILVRGHTDSTPFAFDDERNNWSLSTERADATRRLLQKDGIDTKRFVRIEGVADTEPLIADNPLDARNRRVSIFVRPK